MKLLLSIFMYFFAGLFSLMFIFLIIGSVATEDSSGLSVGSFFFLIPALLFYIAGRKFKTEHKAIKQQKEFSRNYGQFIPHNHNGNHMNNNQSPNNFNPDPNQFNININTSFPGFEIEVQGSNHSEQSSSFTSTSTTTTQTTTTSQSQSTPKMYTRRSENANGGAANQTFKQNNESAYTGEAVSTECPGCGASKSTFVGQTATCDFCGVTFKVK